MPSVKIFHKPYYFAVCAHLRGTDKVHIVTLKYWALILVIEYTHFSYSTSNQDYIKILKRFP